MFCTIPDLHVGRAASLVMPKLGSLGWDYKGKDFLYLLGLGSLFQMLEFLLSWC